MLHDPFSSCPLWDLDCPSFQQGRDREGRTQLAPSLVLEAHSQACGPRGFFSNSDDHLLKNIELFDKLSLRFNGRVLFIKDVIGDEICCWSFYGQGRKLAEVCCTSIVYATEKKQTKVEFPEARIYEETLNVLLYETPRVPDNSLLEATSRSRSQASPSEDEETFELRDRVRRIHVKRYSTYDDRQLGHQSAHRD